MAKSAYSQKLLDPRWQRKRLEKLQQEDFTCQLCGDTTSTLHVHHKAYFKGRDPWEYENDQLAVLCGECHESQHTNEDLLADVVSRLPLDGPFCRDEIAYLVAGYASIDISPSSMRMLNEINRIGGEAGDYVWRVLSKKICGGD